MRFTHSAAVLLLLTPFCAWAGSNYIVATTTLAQQTANNTSAANAFQGQSNGNLGANNVSKVNVHNLLYSGATTKIFAHLLLWFGQPGHVNVGYNSNNLQQVQNQIADMVSRGIDGVIIDWYGPNNAIDQATQMVMQTAEQHAGFTFAIMIDAGAIGQNMCSGCSAQQVLTQLLQYVEQKYFTSSAYFKINNQPVVTNFDIDQNYSIDWNALNSSVPVHPRFFFQDAGGFSHTLSDGSYSWVMPTTSDFGLNYLSNFYATGLGYGNLETVGAGYKGFNDSLAAWGSGRVMNQQCGQTWLQTFSQANSIYNSGQQLPFFQLVTWNDYDEATEIESGIDDCFSLSPAVAGNSLQWAISGEESTIDHYNVYISQDGQNLMTLTQTEPGNRSVSLCNYQIPAGDYQLFVQAVGKPSMANRMPGPVSYSPACPAGSGSGSSGLTATPGTVVINGSEPVQVTVSASKSAPITGSVTLSCGSLPAQLTCNFSPATIDIGSGTASSSLTISTNNSTAKNIHRRSGALYATWFASFGVVGFAFLGNVKRQRKILAVLIVCGLAAGIMMTSACGGGHTSSAELSGAPGANNYTISVMGNSNAGQVSTQIVVSMGQGN